MGFNSGFKGLKALHQLQLHSVAGREYGPVLVMEEEYGGGGS